MVELINIRSTLNQALLNRTHLGNNNSTGKDYYFLKLDKTGHCVCVFCYPKNLSTMTKIVLVSLLYLL